MEALELKTLVANALDGEEWRVIATLKDAERARVPAFEAVELDSADMLGGE